MPQVPIVNQLWSERSFLSGQSARSAWDVSGVATENDAIAAVGIAPLSTHPQDSRLRIPKTGGIDVSFRSPILYHVVANYSSDADGSISGNPLDEPADVLPDFALEMKPINQAVHMFQSGRNPIPIVNSARQPYADNPQDGFGSLRFTISQWESTFDAEKAIAYCFPNPKLNSDIVTITKFGTFQPGQLAIMNMRTETAIRAKVDDVQPYMRVIYTVEARDYFRLKGGVKVSGFAHRLEDVGFQAVYTATNGGIKLGSIVYKDENGKWAAKQTESQLDGNGYPLSDKLFVQSDTTTKAQLDAIEGIVTENTANGTWLYYLTLESVAFSGLGWKV